ncbi:hypothetical protein HZA57_08710, partial [Candidatus Poribacteria bacterium]|nr:hypothetical protein [Candidatus Poribacteria bacterium]
MNRPRLTPDEERQCLEAMSLLGITAPDHEIFSQRGYFAVFLTGLSPDEASSDQQHPGTAEFKEIRKLLWRAGVDRLKVLLENQTTPKGVKGPPEPAAIPKAKYTTPQRPGQQTQQSTAQLSRAAITQALREQQQPAAPKPAAAKPPVPKAAPKPEHESKDGVVRARTTTTVQPVEPPMAARARLEKITTPDDPDLAVQKIRQFCEKNFYHDAHHVAAEYLGEHGIQ